MAEAKCEERLEENVTCSVCFNVYCDPHELICRHTLCLECINQLQRGKQVICPECRKVSNRTKIKKDFKIQKFIDVLHGVVPENQKKRKMKPAFPDQCHVCKESGLPITSLCTICDQYMCQGCEKSHRGFKMSKNHRTSCTKQLAEEIQTNLKQTLMQLQSEEQEIELKYKNLNDKILEINSDKEQQLRSLHKYEEELIEEIKKHCSEMRKRITELNDSAVQNFSVVKEIFIKSKKEIKSHIEILQDLINTKDTTTLLKSAEMTNDSIKQNIKEIQRKLSEMNMPVRYPIRVERGKKWDGNTGPQLKVNDGGYGQREDITLTHLPGIPQMLQNTYKRDQTIKLETLPQRMSFVNDNIWTVDQGDNMKIYHYNLQLIKTMKVKDYVMSMTYDRSNQQVITAHYSGDRGLHQYDLQGRHIHHICTGNYSDVIIHNTTLYALSPKPSPTLHVFTYRDNHWNKDLQVTLNYDNASICDRMCIIGDCIHVSSFSYDCIYTLSLESGQLQHTAGKHAKSGSPGELNGPGISGCHGNTGDILVADWGNHRLQVYSSTCDQWSVVKLQGEKLQWPEQALVDHRAENIWVIVGVSCQLIKYSCESLTSTWS